MQVGQQGMAFAGDAAGTFAKGCARFDAAVHGWQARLVLGMATLAGLAPFVDSFLDHHVLSLPLRLHWVTWGLCALLGVLVLALVVARVGSLRAEDGTWKGSLVVERVGGWFSVLGEGLASWWRLDLSRRLEAVCRASASLAVLALSGCSVAVMALDALALLSRTVQLVDAQTGEAYERGLAWSQALVMAGLLGSLVGFILVRRKREGKALSWTSRSEALPLVLDCNDDRALASVVERNQGTALGAVLRVLGQWQPKHHAYERGYQLSLKRLLDRELPDLELDEEHPLPSPTGGRALRADLTVGPVLIEMKRALSTSAAQHAAGQVEMYLNAWKQGPLLLLVCDSDPVMAQALLCPTLTRLRQQGGVVSLVLARGAKR